jgi:hypothetical protein
MSGAIIHIVSSPSFVPWPVRYKAYNYLFLFREAVDCALCLFPVDPATRLFSGVPMRCGSYWKPLGLAPNDQALAQRLAIEAPSGS